MLRHRLHTAALILLTIAAIALAGAAPAAAEPVRRIGIVVTTKVNVSDEQALRVSATLGEVVHERFGVDVIAGAEAVRRLPPKGVSTRCVADVECRLELGRRLDAEELLLLVMIGAGDGVQIDPTWVDVASGRVTSRPAIELDTGADPRAALERAAPLLLPHLRERSREPAPAPQPRERPEVVVVTPAAAPAESERRFTTATWIATGVSAGALIGATVFSLSSRRKFDTLDGDGCRRMPCSKDDVDSLRRDTILADVFFGTAIVAAGAAVVFFVTSEEEQAAKPGLSVGPGPGGVGLSLGGAF